MRIRTPSNKQYVSGFHYLQVDLFYCSSLKLYLILAEVKHLEGINYDRRFTRNSKFFELYLNKHCSMSEGSLQLHPSFQ